MRLTSTDYNQRGTWIAMIWTKGQQGQLAAR
jgi:hypothetical protein